MSETVITFRVDENLKKAFELCCKNNHRSISGELRFYMETRARDSDDQDVKKIMRTRENAKQKR